MIISAVGAAVLGLVVAADRIAASVVEHRLESRLQCAAGLGSAPDVHLGGFPALTQLASRTLDEISVQARDVQLPTITVGRIDARAEHVGLTDGGVDAGAVTVDATIPYTGTGGLAGLGAGGEPAGPAAGNLRVVGADDAQRLVLQADVTVRGRTLPATVHADVALAGDRLTVTPAEVELSSFGLRLPASRLPAATSRARTVGLPALPAGLAYRSVTPTPEGLRVVAGGTDLHLASHDEIKSDKTCGGTK